MENTTFFSEQKRKEKKEVIVGGVGVWVFGVTVVGRGGGGCYGSFCSFFFLVTKTNDIDVFRSKCLNNV